MSEEILNQLAADMNRLLTEPAGSRRIEITDLTPRDGQQCKLATRVTTDDLLPLCAALDVFLREQVTVLPVTPDQWRNTLLGEVSRHDVLLAIQDQLTYPK